MRKESFPICCLADSDLKSAAVDDMEREVAVVVSLEVVVVVGRVKAVQLAAAAMR